MDYKSKNHSKYLIMYHLIFVCKYRKKLLIKFGEEIKQMIYDLLDESDFGIIEMEVDKDHIHILIESEPKISPLMIVRKIKQETTWRLWKQYKNYLLSHFWKEKTFWSDGYFCCSIGNVSKEIIGKYIQSQG
jgi:putative transposase